MKLRNPFRRQWYLHKGYIEFGHTPKGYRGRHRGNAIEHAILTYTESHEGASMTSPLPIQETAAAGEDTDIELRAELLRQAQREALERVEEKELPAAREEREWRELITDMRQRERESWESAWNVIFQQAAQLMLPDRAAEWARESVEANLRQVYIDKVAEIAWAEHDAAEIVTGDIFANTERAAAAEHTQEIPAVRILRLPAAPRRLALPVGSGAGQ
jgi:hypothetical protein